jgi:uncharacterized protein (TIGR03083 family)
MDVRQSVQTGPTHDEWMALAEGEYARLDALLRTFSDEDWTRPTDCTEWDVRQMVAHLVGAAESNARQREFVRQAFHGRRLRNGGPLVDGINAVQVQERASVPGSQLTEDLRDAAVRGVRARRRLPAALRRVPLPFGPPLGTKPLGYLTDRIYTRDAWLHRVDLCRATGCELELTGEHDGRIVADVVDEWARTHGRPYALTLQGPAGGSWSSGQEGEAHDLDAIEFCRIVSGRATGEGLLATPVPF